MQVTCLGAARTVTGSCYLVEMNEDTSFLVDCGMFQGGRRMEERNWLTEDYRPGEVDAIFITHAHIDHSGLVPRLVSQGYGGPVYASKATAELLAILWLDSAHIQEMEAEWQSRKNQRQGGDDVEPLYTTQDAEAAIKLIKPVEMDCHEEMLPGVDACFITAGHILGAASLFLTLKCDEGDFRLAFSGDLGRPGQLIVPDPEVLPRPDMVFMETTYGSRRHKSLEDSQEELIAVINQAYAEGGKVLIPAFAVERTQELIYTMAKAYRQGRIPKDMPVFLDSPLAIRATEIFRKHPEFFDDEAKAILANGDTPLNFPNLTFTLTTDESREINNNKGPSVIMAGNGMATAGRIKHHLKHNIWRGNCHVVIVGFQAMGTTGRLLVEGRKRVKIFREEVAVNAKVHTIGGFSAHADRKELLEWLGSIVHPKLMVNLIHGEESSTMSFMEAAQRRYPQVAFHVPGWHESIPLAPGLPVADRPEVEARPPLAESVRTRISSLLGRLDKNLGEMDLSDLAALEDSLAQAERVMLAKGLKK